jgi:hypothetical protein
MQKEECWRSKFHDAWAILAQFHDIQWQSFSGLTLSWKILQDLYFTLGFWRNSIVMALLLRPLGVSLFYAAFLQRKGKGVDDDFQRLSGLAIQNTLGLQIKRNNLPYRYILICIQQTDTHTHTYMYAYALYTTHVLCMHICICLYKYTCLHHS